MESTSVRRVIIELAVVKEAAGSGFVKVRNLFTNWDILNAPMVSTARLKVYIGIVLSRVRDVFHCSCISSTQICFARVR